MIFMRCIYDLPEAAITNKCSAKTTEVENMSKCK